MRAQAYRNSLSNNERNALVEQWRPFACKQARRWHQPGMDLDDLIQAALTGLVIAAERFDPSRGVKYQTFAGWWVLNQIQEEVRLSRAAGFGGLKSRLKNYSDKAPRRIYDSGDVQMCEGVSIDAEPDEQAIAVAGILERLGDSRERQIVLLRRICGWTLAEIGWHLGITKERARQLERRALNRLRSELEAV